MEIVLIRHTTPKIEKGICYGQLNVDVRDTFENEVIAIKRQISNYSFDAIYSSPLLRCYKLASKIGNPIFLNSKLKELNFGDWENKAWNTIDEKEINPWMENFVNKRPTNGESYIELQNRAVKFLNTLINEDIKSVAIICHAGTIRALLAYMLNVDLKNSFDFKIEYGQVINISFKNNTFKVISGLHQ